MCIVVCGGHWSPIRFLCARAMRVHARENPPYKNHARLCADLCLKNGAPRCNPIALNQFKMCVIQWISKLVYVGRSVAHRAQRHHQSIKNNKWSWFPNVFYGVGVQCIGL